MPEIFKKNLREIALIYDLVENYFNGDIEKTSLWFRMPNPMLGEISPRDMIYCGRIKTLLEFVKQSFEGQVILEGSWVLLGEIIEKKINFEETLHKNSRKYKVYREVREINNQPINLEEVIEK